MKLGIVSIYDNGNFGNRLQNYAMQQALKKYGDDVVTIKNKRYNVGKRSILRFLPIFDWIFFNRLCGRYKRARLLEFNKKYITLNKKCYWFDKDYAALDKNDNCDFYCVGSDQVWNPNFGRAGMFNSWICG